MNWAEYLKQHENRADKCERIGERTAALYCADESAHGDRERRGQNPAQQKCHPPRGGESRRGLRQDCEERPFLAIREPLEHDCILPQKRGPEAGTFRREKNRNNHERVGRRLTSESCLDLRGWCGCNSSDEASERNDLCGRHCSTRIGRGAKRLIGKFARINFDLDSAPSEWVGRNYERRTLETHCISAAIWVHVGPVVT